MTRTLYDHLSGFALNALLEINDNILMRIFNGCTSASSRDVACPFSWDENDDKQYEL